MKMQETGRMACTVQAFGGVKADAQTSGSGRVVSMGYRGEALMSARRSIAGPLQKLAKVSSASNARRCAGSGAAPPAACA